VTPQDQKNIGTIRNAITLIKSFVDYDDSIAKLTEIQAQTENPDFWNDTENAVKIMKEKDSIITMIAPADYLEKKLDDVIGMMELADSEGDDGLVLELSNDLTKLAKEAITLQIESILSERHDSASCFLEVNAGAGGTEAQDWAEMLARMYTRWAEKRKYKIEIADKDDGDEAGVKSIRLHIQGNKAYGWLKKESGVHRLVRISPFDSNARRHTSFASVLVTPEVDSNIEIEINPSDLRIDTYRASGPGGQHVNKTESAIRITHIPTGLVVASQIDRSQHRNKEIAMNMLRSKLYAQKLREQEEASNPSQPKTDIAWGNQIRSYVLQPYKMVKDSRTGVENGNALAVLEGDIDDFLEAAVSQL
jgi:peptide chain release factor 2